MDRFAASVGFVLAGLGLAASFLDWTAAVAGYGLGSPAAALTATVALAAFAARRHGAADRWLSLVAGLGSVVIALVATAALLLPAMAGRPGAPIGIGVPAGMAIGVLGVATAYADWVGIERSAFVRKAKDATIALGVGVGGLVFGTLLVAVAQSLVGAGLSPAASYGFKTIVSSVGFVIVALWFVKQVGGGFDYLDLSWPDRRGALYVIGGSIAMFILLIVLTQLSQALGLPSAEHGLMKDAKKNPGLLLVLLPLSWLAIAPGEELLNRNAVQKFLYESFSRRSAVLVGTVVFTLAHVPAYATGTGAAALFVTLTRLFAISLVLGVVYERTRNLVVPILIHGIYDAIQFGLAYIMITTGYL